jgi:hypothetical protein
LISAQIREQADRTLTLEQRVKLFEYELLSTQKLMLTTLERLEKHLNIDLDENDYIGS